MGKNTSWQSEPEVKLFLCPANCGSGQESSICLLMGPVPRSAVKAAPHSSLSPAAGLILQPLFIKIS